ncbi:hypothetical protein H072_8135 [Dactylellina haptotyla CBS 200.50]|uniref:F-box domain-containing protein n=1 Tax=Dactylellina haptotyla (strain CBS 200.50) TaxID=1284197 RepID=S8AAK9_DACHA|nr:hypothetical protein H072_8135 [Dactylellina haptotyla CBS 200.50]
MVGSLPTLPLEILHEIFTQEILAGKDYINCTLVCRALYAVARGYIVPNDGKIVLRSNNFEKSVSLLRRLLSDVTDFAKKFTEVTIKWQYKRDKLNEEQRKRLDWSAKELESLEALYEKYAFNERWRKSINELIDPASLLVPIICLLDGLEVLDMGSVAASYEPRELYNDSLETHFEEWLIGLSRRGEKEDVADVQKLLEGYPPSLRGLKEFTRGEANDDGDGFDLDDVTSIWLIDGIERVSLSVCGGDFGCLKKYSDEGWECTVKEVEFWLFECAAENVAGFFEMCEGLKRVRVNLYCINHGTIEDEEELEEKFKIYPMSSALCDHHRETLDYAQVDAERDEWWYMRKKGKIRTGGKTGWIGDGFSSDEG